MVVGDEEQAVVSVILMYDCCSCEDLLERCDPGFGVMDVLVAACA